MINYWLVLILTFYAVNISLSSGQVFTGEDASNGNCTCSQPCKPVLDCKSGKTSIREDCPCCKICLGSEGETCEGKEAPCNEEENLNCSSVGKCEVVKCKNDNDCQLDKVCIRETCIDPCLLLQPCQGNDIKGVICFTKSHQPLCECPLGTVKNLDLKACTSSKGKNGTEESRTSSARKISGAVDHFISNLDYDEREADLQALLNPNNSIDLSQFHQTKNKKDVIVSTPHSLDISKKNLGKNKQDNLFDFTHKNAKFHESILGHSRFSSNQADSISPILSEKKRTTTPDSRSLSQILSSTAHKVFTSSPKLENEITEQKSSIHPNKSKLASDKGEFQQASSPEEKLFKLSTKSGVLGYLSLTPNSTSLNLPSSAGGVIHYKESFSDNESLRKVIEQGDTKLTIDGLTPNTKYTFKWAGADGSSSKIEIKTEDGCMHDNQTFTIGAKWHEGCQTTCMCHIGGISDCRPRCVFVAGAIQDEQCEEIPSSSDPHCCVEYVCKRKDNSILKSPAISNRDQSQEREPKLIVTGRSHNSITVAWDDFRADNPERKYVTEYRQVPDEKIDAQIPWMKKSTLKGQPPPTMTLGELNPNTVYEVRVGIYSQSEERQLIAATETIKVRTEAGCVYGNTSFAVGLFFQGCEERCTCSQDGAVKCTGRCTIPYFKKGSFAHDRYCFEESAGDECCVLVMCAHGGEEGIEDYDQCANTVCGKNAECVSWPTLTEASHNQDLPQPGSCRCRKGFKGDPTDHTVGCIPDPSTTADSNKCIFRLKSYNPGEVFYDGCLSKCTCSQLGEIECQPRCQFGFNDTKSSLDGLCSFVPDPNDECCRIRVCSSSSSNSVAQPPPPPLNFDGCVYRNVTYSKNEEFLFGCHSRCLCMGLGDVSCSPRCPPVKEVPNEEGIICETLTDPDDECCNVTVCDKYPQDVMKTTTLNKTSSLDSLNKNLSTDIDSVTNNDTSSMININGPLNLKANVNNFENTIQNDVIASQNEKSKNDSSRNTSSNSTFSLLNNNLEGRSGILFPGDSVHMSKNSAETDAPVIFPNEISPKISSQRTKEARLDTSAENSLEIMHVEAQDSSTVLITVIVNQDLLSQLLSSQSERITVSYSHDSLTWDNKTISVDDIQIKNMYEVFFLVQNLVEYEVYYFRVFYRSFSSPIYKASLAENGSNIGKLSRPSKSMCSMNGKRYKSGEHFYKGCKEFCICTENGTNYCNPIECPAHFGLDILEPGCLEWEDDLSFNPTPPKCCGQMPKCALHIDQLACEHMGQKFSHLDFIPKELIGCDKRCQCLSGELDCESLCSPVSALPPFHLPCDLKNVRLVTASAFPCCREWRCLNDTVKEGTHPEDHITNVNTVVPPITTPDSELSFVGVDEITDTSARILFYISELFVGLPGGIYLRFTDNAIKNPNPLNWKSEVIHQDGVIINQADWQYVKKSLMPSSNYSMQLVLSTHLKKTENISPIFTVVTLPSITTPLPHVELDAKIYATDITNTSAIISWKRFDELEFNYIDGLRVRYWKANKKFPSEGPMLHREAGSMFLKNLSPDTKYTVDLVFIPKEGLEASVTSFKNFSFSTLPKPRDKYDFEISIRSGKVSRGGVQILYSGIPRPEGKYVHVFRVVYTSDGDLHDSEKFSIPRTSKTNIITITNMKPGVAYEVWLEAYLTNGMKKKSNVITVRTQPGRLPIPEKSEINDSKSHQLNVGANYYSAFVAMLILTLVAVVVIMGLAAILLRRKNNLKAHISSKTATAAYDNPSYKASDNQANYAIEMNRIRGSSNGRTDDSPPTY